MYHMEFYFTKVNGAVDGGVIYNFFLYYNAANLLASSMFITRRKVLESKIPSVQQKFPSPTKMNHIKVLFTEPPVGRISNSDCFEKEKILIETSSNDMRKFLLSASKLYSLFRKVD